MSIKYPVIDVSSTGKNLRRLCILQGISVRDLQRYCGFSNPQSVYRWFSGANLPSVDNLYALSVLLGVTMNDIIVDKDDDVVFALLTYKVNETVNEFWYIEFEYDKVQ